MLEDLYTIISGRNCHECNRGEGGSSKYLQMLEHICLCTWTESPPTCALSQHGLHAYRAQEGSVLVQVTGSAWAVCFLLMKLLRQPLGNKMTFPKPSQAPEHPNNFCLTNTDSFFTVKDGALPCLPFGRLSDACGSLNKGSSRSQSVSYADVSIQPLFKATQPSCSSPEDTCEHTQRSSFFSA